MKDTKVIIATTLIFVGAAGHAAGKPHRQRRNGDPRGRIDRLCELLHDEMQENYHRLDERM